jgi:hypothetical protein
MTVWGLTKKVTVDEACILKEYVCIQCNVKGKMAII